VTDWVPGEVDVERPSTARIYDYNLGGSHNFAADRRLAQQLNEVMPELPAIQRANRSFLRRAVRYLVDAGVRQLLDLGSGIPTLGNVHEIAQHADPATRVVYVDIDPVAVAHSRAMLAGNANAIAIQADLRQAERILTDPELRELFDFAAPVAVLMVGVLHYFPDSDDPAGLVATYRDAVAPGSYLAISHASQEGAPDGTARAIDLFSRTGGGFHLRSREEITHLFDSYQLVEPGLVYLTAWRPEAPGDVGDRPEWTGTYAGVGRTPPDPDAPSPDHAARTRSTPSE
jgi:SAM-dependent methyltransferase